MVNGAARKAVTLEDILEDFKNRFQLIESDLRQRRGFQSTETKPIGTSSGTTSAGITGFLKNSGDAMDGPLAVSPLIATISSGIIDISKDLAKAYTSYILLNPEAGADDTLNTIKGVAFPGQIVIFQVTNATITFSNTDNIQGKDTKVETGDTISFIFDSIGVGKWRLWGGTGGASGYNLIQEEGTPLPQRQILNFTGPGVTAIDNPALNRTDISAQGVEFVGPWTVAHDAGKKTLNDLNALEIVDINGLTRGLIQGPVNSRVDFKLTSGHILRFFDNITPILDIAAAGIIMAAGKRLDMNVGTINKTKAIEFDVTNNFNPTNINTIGFDLGSLSLIYNTSSFSNVHRFRAGGESLAFISRIGTNRGAVSAALIQGTETIEALQKMALSTFNNVSPQNGHFWRDISTGLYQFRQNGITVGLGGTGALDGVQDFHPWLLHETTQYNEEVYMSNSKVGAGTTDVAYSQDLLYFMPFYLGKRARITKIGVVVKGGFTGNYTLSMGIYANRTDGQNYPASKITDGIVISSTTGAKIVNLSPQNLEPGLYWLAFDCTTDNLTLEQFLEGDCNSAGFRLTTSGIINFQPITGFLGGHSSQVLPANAANNLTLSAASSNAVPAMYVKFIPNTN